jgi:hypothetical protein
MGALQTLPHENNKTRRISPFTKQSIIIRTLKTRSLLPSLYKREKLPLFGKEGRPACAKPLRRRQGGDFLKHMSSLFYYGSLGKSI